MTDDRSSREIERDLERKRDDLRGTIDEALDRMTLEGAWTYAGRYLRDHRSEYGQTVGSVFKEKPLAVGLVAIGMAWIMFGPSNVDRASRDDNYRDNDRRDDSETRRRLAAGDFDETSAQGPTGSDARPDPWAAPSQTPSSTPERSGVGPKAVGGTSSPATSTSAIPAEASSSSAGTSGSPSTTRASTEASRVATPAVAPTSSPVRTGEPASSVSKPGSGTQSGSAGTSTSTTTTDPNSSKV